MNFPNWITVGRLILIPVFVALAYSSSEGSAVAAFLVFAVASASDSLDGYVARKMDLVSRLGQFLDPLADKLLIGAALFVLVDLRAFPLWAALLIGAREVVVQILRIRVVSGGGDLPASAAAKLKTATQIALVSWWLLPFDEVGPVHWVLLSLALVTTLWSGFEYLMTVMRAEEATT
jgi:CDP-diacylglycerol---glycerol-3-phosphate 3-phosphatidyltransferase